MHRQPVHPHIDRSNPEWKRETENQGWVSSGEQKRVSSGERRGKIRCHLLCCVIALVALRLIEETVNANRAGEAISSSTILDRMRQLHSVLLLYPGKREAERVLETPEKTQSEVLSAFGYRITDGGVLQEV